MLRCRSCSPISSLGYLSSCVGSRQASALKQPLDSLAGFSHPSRKVYLRPAELVAWHRATEASARSVPPFSTRWCKRHETRRIGSVRHGVRMVVGGAAFFGSVYVGSSVSSISISLASVQGVEPRALRAAAAWSRASTTTHACVASPHLVETCCCGLSAAALYCGRPLGLSEKDGLNHAQGCWPLAQGAGAVSPAGSSSVRGMNWKLLRCKPSLLPLSCTAWRLSRLRRSWLWL
jgi:hypothetical protein